MKTKPKQSESRAIKLLRCRVQALLSVQSEMCNQIVALSKRMDAQEAGIQLHEPMQLRDWADAPIAKPPRKPYINEDGSVNWSLVPVDTKVIDWYKGKNYFSHYEDGVVALFNNGKTSWTSESTVSWQPDLVRLADE